MSRLRLPRRFSAALYTLIAAALATAPALAQGRDPRSVTAIGTDANIRRCTDGVNSGDLSDRTVENCTRALNYRHIDRATTVQVLVNRGVIHMRRRENESALADFDAALASDPAMAEAHLNRGAVLVQMGRHGPAIAALTEALSRGVSEPHKAYYNRAAAREALGDLRGAYEDYSTALEIRPDWGPANAELARFVRGRREYLAEVLREENGTP